MLHVRHATDRAARLQVPARPAGTVAGSYDALAQNHEAMKEFSCLPTDERLCL